LGITSLSTTFTSTKTTFSLPSFYVLWPYQFITNDDFYVDAFAFNGTTSWNSDVFTVYVSNNAAQGVAGDFVINAPSLLTTGTGLTHLVGLSSFATGSGLPVINESFQLADALDNTSVLTDTLKDVPGTSSFVRGMPTLISDHDKGLLYSGYVYKDIVSKLSANPSNTELAHKMTFMDQTYAAKKRANTTNYLNWQAGDIACDFVQKTLNQEGITGEFALESDYTPATLGAGTLTNVVATTTTTPFTNAPNTATPPVTSNTGDLEITAAGRQITISEATIADFASGTLTNMIASSSGLSPTTQSALRVQAQLPLSIGQAGNEQAQVQIWSGSQAVGSNDSLNYDIFISSTSPTFIAAVDLGFADGTLLSGVTSGAFDQNGLLPGPTTPAIAAGGGSPAVNPGAIDLTGYAKDTWYSRIITLSGLSGKTITGVFISIAGATAGLYTVYVKNCYLLSASGSPFFSTTATVPQLNPPVITALGYISSMITTTVVNVYDPALSSRLSPAHSLDAVKLMRSSTIAWTASLPLTGTPGMPVTSTGTAPTAVISVSYDGLSWLPCTNNQALPGLPAGAIVAGLSLSLMETFTAGSDPTAIPALVSVTITFKSAANTSTSDVTATYGNAAQWNSGTFTNTTVNANGRLTLGSVLHNWSNNQIIKQTFFANFGASQSASGGVYTISVSGLVSEGKSRLDYAGPGQDFTFECDVSFSGNAYAGPIYRQSNWTQ